MKMTAAASHLDKEVLETAKVCSLSVACTNLCLFATKNEQSYMIALDKIQRLTLRIEQMVVDDESAKRARNCVLQAGMELKDSVTVNIKVALKPLNMMGLKLANAVSVFSLAILNGLARYIRQRTCSLMTFIATLAVLVVFRLTISQGIVFIMC